MFYCLFMLLSSSRHPSDRKDCAVVLVDVLQALLLLYTTFTYSLLLDSHFSINGMQTAINNDTISITILYSFVVCDADGLFVIFIVQLYKPLDTNIKKETLDKPYIGGWDRTRNSALLFQRFH